MPHPRATTSGQDPRELGTYRLSEAAHYLRLPKSTLRSWVIGQSYPTGGGRRFFQPLVGIADQEHRLLSFFNLVEVHVLDAMRREFGIPLQRVRGALQFLKKELPSPHPLADHRFETDGFGIFVRKAQQIIEVSRSGQITIGPVLEEYLRRIDWDKDGLAARLFPFTTSGQVKERRAVVIDPAVSFGRPTLVRRGITTSIIAERYKAGERPEDLAADYEVSGDEIHDAIRYELTLDVA